jgi:hypothetical protein
MRDPDSVLEWSDVAAERAKDANRLQSADRPLAALYMLGFAVECYAKALCSNANRPVPKGRNGHDIIAILETAGIGRTVLPVDLRAFAETRDVGLRYQAEVPEEIDISLFLERGRRLAGWCYTRLQRRQRDSRRQRL